MGCTKPRDIDRMYFTKYKHQLSSWTSVLSSCKFQHYKQEWSTISTLLLQIFQPQSSHVFYRKSRKSLELLTPKLWAKQQSLLTVSIRPTFNCQPLGQPAPGTITAWWSHFTGHLPTAGSENRGWPCSPSDESPVNRTRCWMFPT